MMEKWKEIFKERIPEGIYQVQISHGEENGLVVKLENFQNIVEIDFGNVLAVRILDEGIIQRGIYSESEIKKYKNDNFSNVIYEVEGGQFKNKIEYISNGYLETLSIRHYVIITQNYNIDVVTRWKPEIEIKMSGNENFSHC